MSNSFDNKIKEILEKFEMPYDATAWAELEKQLPKSSGAPAEGGTKSGLKVAALFALVATTVCTIWYINKDTGNIESKTPIVEQVSEPENNTIIKETEPKKAPTSSNTQPKTESVATTENKETTTESAPSTSPKQELVAEQKEAVESEKPAQLSEPKNTPKKESSDTEKNITASTENELKVNVIASSRVVCAGEEVKFINESSDKKVRMNWDFGDGSSSSAVNPSHVYVIPGNYTVNLDGLKGDKTSKHSIEVTVNPAPNPNLSPSKKFEEYRTTPLYTFSTPLQPSETAVWKFTDGMTTKGAKAEHLFRDAGKVGVELTVKNAFGCSTSQKWTFDNEKFNLLAYTGFSPDGNGNNETFMPPALQFMGVEFVMVIRNQTGQIVYETSNPTEPWNGRLNNSGSVLSPGIYIWTVVLKDEILSKKDFNGTITLKR